MTYSKFDVIVVPFPFTNKITTKKRPALVVSNQKFNENSQNTLLAMITKAEKSEWPHDMAIKDLDSAGLPVESIIRMKLFTLDNRFILKKVGSLSEKDRKKFSESFNSTL